MHVEKDTFYHKSNVLTDPMLALQTEALIRIDLRELDPESWHPANVHTNILA